ncbi:MAG: hypothetical protein ABH841_01935 [Candidatus Nealsonbacteria bacterium]
MKSILKPENIQDGLNNKIMQAFELYFNPRLAGGRAKKRDNLFLTSFIYTPANIYEKRLGNLYVVGELTQAMPQNSHFLTSLSSVIKKEYYASGLAKSCEASLQEALKKGNEFLNQESRNGNVGWLGNLNLSVISIKDSVLNFAKVGDIKIFLVRSNELMDLSRNLETEFPAPDPLKVFSSMAGGKISDEDKIIVLNKRILTSSNKKQKFLGELARASNEKELKQVFKTYHDHLVNLSGIGLILMANSQNESKQTLTLQNDLPNFSFSLPHFKIPKIKLPKIISPNFPHLLKMFKLPKLPKLPEINFRAVRKPVILVVSLIAVLLSFYYIFQGEKSQELRDAQMILNEAQSKAMLAESLLILKKDSQAKALFEETLQILSPLTKRGSPLRDDALFLQNSVKQFLK